MAPATPAKREISPVVTDNFIPKILNATTVVEVSALEQVPEEISSALDITEEEIAINKPIATQTVVELKVQFLARLLNTDRACPIQMTLTVMALALPASEVVAEAEV